MSSIFEFSDLTPPERWRLFAKCHLRSFCHWQTWAGLLAAVAIAAACQLTMRWLLPSLTARDAPLFGFTGAVFGWIVGGHFSWTIRVKVVRKLLRQQLPHLCRECGYDCRASTVRCPECGAATSPSIAIPQKQLT